MRFRSIHLVVEEVDPSTGSPGSSWALNSKNNYISIEEWVFSGRLVTINSLDLMMNVVICAWLDFNIPINPLSPRMNSISVPEIPEIVDQRYIITISSKTYF